MSREKVKQIDGTYVQKTKKCWILSLGVMAVVVGGGLAAAPAVHAETPKTVITLTDSAAPVDPSVALNPLNSFYSAVSQESPPVFLSSMTEPTADLTGPLFAPSLPNAADSSSAADSLIPNLAPVSAGINEVASTLPTLLAPAKAATEVKPSIQVSADKQWLVDADDRVVIVHGLNLVQKNAPFYPENQPDQFTQADVDFLKTNGFNAIRLGIMFEGVMPERGLIDETYLANIGDIVQKLSEAGIYTILDFHQDVFSHKWGGDGFPDWAVDDMGIPSIPGVGFPNAYFQLSTQAAFENFWNNTNGVLTEYMRAQQAIAAHFASTPNILGIELINEPMPGFATYFSLPLLGNPSFGAKLTKIYAEMRAGIRAVAPLMPVFEAPLMSDASGVPSYLGAANDANTVYAFHIYNPAGAGSSIYPLIQALFSDSYSIIKPLDDMVWASAAANSKAIGGPELLTEFGATDDLATLVNVTAEANAHLSGWFYWAYKTLNDPATIGSDGIQSLFTNDADLTTVKADKLAVLVQTYPRAIAGVPQDLFFDPATGKFDCTYTAGNQTSPTEIYVSPLHYPHGYEVNVVGAQLLSQTASLVSVGQAELGATVQVHITARSVKPAHNSVEYVTGAGDLLLAPNPVAIAGNVGDTYVIPEAPELVTVGATDYILKSISYNGSPVTAGSSVTLAEGGVLSYQYSPVPKPSAPILLTMSAALYTDQAFHTNLMLKQGTNSDGSPMTVEQLSSVEVEIAEGPSVDRTVSGDYTLRFSYTDPDGQAVSATNVLHLVKDLTGMANTTTA